MCNISYKLKTSVMYNYKVFLSVWSCWLYKAYFATHEFNKHRRVKNAKTSHTLLPFAVFIRFFSREVPWNILRSSISTEFVARSSLKTRNARKNFQLRFFFRFNFRHAPSYRDSCAAFRPAFTVHVQRGIRFRNEPSDYFFSPRIVVIERPRSASVTAVCAPLVCLERRLSRATRAAHAHFRRWVQSWAKAADDRTALELPPRWLLSRCSVQRLADRSNRCRNGAVQLRLWGSICQTLHFSFFFFFLQYFVNRIITIF